MNFKPQKDTFQSYENLQKQLDQQHKRLLRQREQMLSRQSEKLQFYQKIDLVEFFNYEPSESESSKKEIMYHLSEKFKNYMRNFTQNNVYKQLGHLVNENPSRQRSASKSKGKTNVQKNSDLGRMFQTQRYIQNFYRANTLSPRTYEADQKFHQKILSMQENLSNQQEPTQRNLFSETNILAHQKQSILEPQILLSAQQLSHALDQQQKIYLLTELNYYIKLYKESQTKKQFMTKHLQNLHEYLVDVRLNYESRNKTKSKSQAHSRSSLIEENQMLKRQIQTYKRQIKALNRMENQNFYQNFPKNQTSKERSQTKYIQVKKIDRFKEFADHIHIMQNHLFSLIQSFNHCKNDSSQKSYIQNLQLKIQELEKIISEENRKKDIFFQEVKKFKEIMKRKDQEVCELNQELRKYKLRIDKNTRENQQFTYENLSDQSNYHLERSQSKKKYSRPQKTMRFQKQNQLSSRKDEFDRFIDSAMKNTNNQQSQKSFRYSRITTKQPSETELRNSQLKASKVSNYRLSTPNLEFNETKFIQNPNSASRTTYHSRMMDLCQNLASRQTNSSRSKSRYSKSRERTKTNCFDNYEPKPYERYNNFSEYSSLSTVKLQNQRENNPLYNRIPDYHRDHSKSHKTLNA